ncbi:hypothetical protein GYMLUDRAFT_249082 [Collybiopsis luxurians FD-317 M1]|uniref:Uncharacterized protein n=1 Tax=Collybiopsis luxurians FD-317 M1 TaxID=944289 RepID=A0A0D0CIS6_9AGAR|nr:hypothetical protein GYMLUDRAFT_249082 [Collybiopsis luxurians FD-317 M1]
MTLRHQTAMIMFVRTAFGILQNLNCICHVNATNLSILYPPSLEELVQLQLELTKRLEGAKEATEKVAASHNLQALQNVVSEVMQKWMKDMYLLDQGVLPQSLFLCRRFKLICCPEDGTDIIAHVNGSRALQDEDTSKFEILRRIESEYATVQYSRKNTAILVPEPLHMDLNFENNVGALYTLQRRNSATQGFFIPRVINMDLRGEVRYLKTWTGVLQGGPIPWNTRIPAGVGI